MTKVELEHRVADLELELEALRYDISVLVKKVSVSTGELSRVESERDALTSLVEILLDKQRRTKKSVWNEYALSCVVAE